MLPKDEKYVLSMQMRRAAISISSNIAEGKARGGKDFARFLRIADGSRSELESQIALCVSLGYLSKEAVAPLLSSLKEIGRMIGGLIDKVSGG